MSSSPELDALIAQVKGVMLAAIAVDEKDLDECIATFERAEAIGWAIDPTAYRNNAKARDLALRMMRATRTFRIKAAELARESAEAFAQEQARTQREARIAETYAGKCCAVEGKWVQGKFARSSEPPCTLPDNHAGPHSWQQSTVIHCAICGHRETEHAWQSSGGDGGRRYDPPRCTVDGCQCGRFIGKGGT